MNEQWGLDPSSGFRPFPMSGLITTIIVSGISPTENWGTMDTPGRPWICEVRLPGSHRHQRRLPKKWLNRTVKTHSQTVSFNMSHWKFNDNFAENQTIQFWRNIISKQYLSQILRGIKKNQIFKSSLQKKNNKIKEK